MYHFIKLFKLLKNDRNYSVKLIAENEKNINKSIEKKTVQKLIIYGLVEIIPLLSGAILSILKFDFIFEYDYFVFGLTLTIILIFIFKSKVPEIPIGYKQEDEIK